jgi:hypothetical protein
VPSEIEESDEEVWESLPLTATQRRRLEKQRQRCLVLEDSAGAGGGFLPSPPAKEVATSAMSPQQMAAMEASMQTAVAAAVQKGINAATAELQARLAKSERKLEAKTMELEAMVAAHTQSLEHDGASGISGSSGSNAGGRTAFFQPKRYAFSGIMPSAEMLGISAEEKKKRTMPPRSAPLKLSRDSSGTDCLLAKDINALLRDVEGFADGNAKRLPDDFVSSVKIVSPEAREYAFRVARYVKWRDGEDKGKEPASSQEWYNSLLVPDEQAGHYGRCCSGRGAALLVSDTWSGRGDARRGCGTVH